MSEPPGELIGSLFSLLWNLLQSNFVSTMAGVVIGGLFALWLDRRRTGGQKREEAIRVLSALRDEINHNFGLMSQIENEIPKGVPLYPLDLSAWEATGERRLAAIGNYELLRKISHLYYEYQHLARKVDLQFSMHFSTMRAFSNYDEIRGNMAKHILAHINTLKPETEQIISEIDKELTRLKN